VYVSGAVCTESEGATLSTFLVLSFSVVSRLLSTGWGLVGGHVVGGSNLCTLWWSGCVGLVVSTAKYSFATEEG